MTIADLRRGAQDAFGEPITLIYGFKPPEYAVYATDRRLAVHFADNPTLESEQRKGLAPLNPVRGEINGLIDGWRLRFEASGLRQKAARYDRRVADALIFALEHDVEGAAILLKEIKQDIIDDRTSWARLEYLISALIASLLLIVLVWSSATRDSDAIDLWRAAAAGALGAFFSISLNIRSRTILPDLRRVSNITDASLRVGIGFIAASVLMALVDSKAVTLGFGGVSTWLAPMITGFLAGFSERLVPDLLAKTNLTVTPPSVGAAPRPMPAAEAGKSSASATRSPGPTMSKPAANGDTDDGAQGQADEEADLDHCLCDIGLAAADITRDGELPPASGGVDSVEGQPRK